MKISMYYVYLMESINFNFLYIGSTPDLRKRFNQHNNKEVISTKHYAPFELIYYEAYANRKDALMREQKLKHHGSVIGHLKKRVEFSRSKKSKGRD